MKKIKTLLAVLCAFALLMVAAAHAVEGERTTSPKYPVHWMPVRIDAPCVVKEYSYKTIVGQVWQNPITGKTVCYTPRQRHRPTAEELEKRLLNKV